MVMSKQCCAINYGPEEFIPLKNPDSFYLWEVWHEAGHKMLQTFRFYRDKRPNQQLHAHRLAGAIFRMRETLHDMDPTRPWMGGHPHAVRIEDYRDEGL